MNNENTLKISKELFSAVQSYIEENFQDAGIASYAASECADRCEIQQFTDEYKSFERKAMPLCAPSASRKLEDLINHRAETFSEMLFRLIDEKGMEDVEVYRRANIDRKLFSKMRKRDYIPKKINVIALIIALKLNMDEAKDLLARAGYAFSMCSKFDIIVMYFIEKKNYDIFEINDTLYSFEQPTIGA